MQTFVTYMSTVNSYVCKQMQIVTIVIDNEEDDDDFEEGKKEGGRRRRGGAAGDKERPLPPLLARVNGQIEVLLLSFAAIAGKG